MDWTVPVVAPLGRRRINLTGRRFGRLTAIVPTRLGTGRPAWECECDCSPGVFFAVDSGKLREGAKRSCGCLARELSAQRMTTHGRTNTVEFNTWSSMLDRTGNPNNQSYANYGGRGISVCERWKGVEGFANFLADMGERPAPGLSLDRIDNEAGYFPGNCRWATWAEQASNRRTLLRRPRTHCKQGHPLDATHMRRDMQGKRYCATCKAESQRRRRQAP